MRKIIFIAIFIFGSLIFFRTRERLSTVIWANRVFVVDQKYDSNGRNQVEATLRKIGHARILCGNKYFNSLIHSAEYF